MTDPLLEDTTSADDVWAVVVVTVEVFVVEAGAPAERIQKQNIKVKSEDGPKQITNSEIVEYIGIKR